MVFIFVWLTWFSIIISRSIHVATKGIISLYFTVEYHSIIYMYHTFFMHSSVDGYLRYFHVLAIVNCTAMNIRVYVSCQTKVPLWGPKWETLKKKG